MTTHNHAYESRIAKGQANLQAHNERAQQSEEYNAEWQGPTDRTAEEQRTQHTPGPWQTIGHQVLTIDDSGNKSVADVFGESEEQEWANARLIAAAPGLLAAAKTFVEQYPNNVGASAARAEIAKAEGRAL